MRIIAEDTIFNGSVTFNGAVTTHVDILKTVATPNINNVTVFKSPSAPISVTNFLGGSSGQSLYILGNGNLTLVNGTLIKTSTGANKLLASNKVYQLKLIDDIWYEVTN